MSMTLEAKNRVADEQISAAADPTEPAPEIDLDEHREVYRWFVRGTFLFAAHVLAVLLVLGYVFSDSFG
jgi:hypothetical protein